MKLSDLIKYCADNGHDDSVLMIEGEYCIPAVVTGFDLGVTITAGHASPFVLLERAQDEDDA